jgi:hypothetical protein
MKKLSMGVYRGKRGKGMGQATFLKKMKKGKRPSMKYKRY